MMHIELPEQFHNIIYKKTDISLELKTESDTVRANIQQMSQLFQVDKSVITRHIKNIFDSNELDKEEVCAFFAHTTRHGSIKGKTQTRNIAFYNLDMILSVGYRVNSTTATQFRKRATVVLHQYTMQGYALNHSRIGIQYYKILEFIKTIKLLNYTQNTSGEDIIDLIQLFGQTWFSLNAYDKGDFGNIDTHLYKESLVLYGKQLYDDILYFKNELLQKNEASDLFAREKINGSIEGIFANIYQTAFGEDIYPSIELKSAHLLYFIIKNHPFVDGNKRSGAFAFIRFLRKNKYSFELQIQPQTLTALTLLIATSDPKDKAKIIDLILLFLHIS